MQRGRFVPRGAVLSAQALSYRHADGAPLFESLSLSLTRSCTGLVGTNGSGKTTLLEILAGRRVFCGGRVIASGAVAFLAQRDEIGEAATVAELMNLGEVVAALTRVEAGEFSQEDIDRIGNDWDVPARARASLDSIGLRSVSLDRLVATLSGGERTRARLAGCLLAEPDVMILDEPTNHLDREARAWLFHWMSGWRGAVLVASHDRELLRGCDEIWDLGERGLRVYGGNYDFYRAAREAEEANAAQATANAKAERDRAREDLTAAVERQKKRAERGLKQSTKANEPKIFRGRQKERAENTLARRGRVHEDRVARAETQWQDTRREMAEKGELKLDFATEVIEKRGLAEVRDLNIWLPSGVLLWENPVSFSLRGGDRLALVGPNGCGKTALLRAFFSEALKRTGTIDLRKDRTAYLDQFSSDLRDELTLLENLLRIEPSLGETTARIRLGRLGFAQEDSLKRAGSLSGGERMRLSLGCLFAKTSAPELLLLDEPTNHLDLPSLEVVEAALRNYPGAILVASHDEAFLQALGVTAKVELQKNILL